MWEKDVRHQFLKLGGESYAQTKLERMKERQREERKNEGAARARQFDMTASTVGEAKLPQAVHAAGDLSSHSGRLRRRWRKFRNLPSAELRHLPNRELRDVPAAYQSSAC